MPDAPDTADADAAWFRPPRLKTGGEHRQATWLELFFDLVFVVAVAGLAGLLRDDLSPSGVGWFAFLFLPAWWLWVDVSYYGDQFDTDDVVYRLALLAVMFGVVTIGRVAPQIVEGRAAWGGLVFAAMYAVLCGLYVRAWRPNPELRPLIVRYATATALSAGLYAASAAVPAPWRFGLWTLAVLVPMVNSPLAYYRLPDLPSQLSHMPERFGLFAIIALGESIAGVAVAVGEAPRTPAVAAASAAGFALAAGLWWTYFIREDPSSMSVALDGGRRGVARSHVYGYAHFLVYAGVVAASVGVEEAVLAAGGPHAFPPTARAVLAGGVAVSVAGMAAVHRAAVQGLPTPALAARLSVAAGLCVVAALPLSPAVALGAASGGVVALAAFETWLLPHPSSLPNEAADPARRRR